MPNIHLDMEHTPTKNALRSTYFSVTSLRYSNFPDFGLNDILGQSQLAEFFFSVSLGLPLKEFSNSISRNS